MLEDVGGAGVGAPGILKACPHDGGVTADRHAPTEAVVGLGVGSGELVGFVERCCLGAVRQRDG